MKDEEKDEEQLDLFIRAVDRLTAAVTVDAAEGKDAAGGSVSSLTEAVMGITAGLFEVANAIYYHADKQSADQAEQSQSRSWR